MDISSAEQNIINLASFAILEIDIVFVEVAQTRNQFDVPRNVLKIVLHLHFTISPCDVLGPIFEALKGNVLC